MKGRYRHVVRVRYGEVDMQGVVFNARYLAYCDDAIDVWFRSLGVDFEQLGYDVMVKKATVEWASGARVAEELAIDVAVSRWGTTSFDVVFDGHVGERPCFTAVLTYVGIVGGTTNTTPPPAAFRELLGDAVPWPG